MRKDIDRGYMFQALAWALRDAGPAVLEFRPNKAEAYTSKYPSIKPPVCAMDWKCPNAAGAALATARYPVQLWRDAVPELLSKQYVQMIRGLKTHKSAEEALAIAHTVFPSASIDMLKFAFHADFWPDSKVGRMSCIAACFAFMASIRYGKPTTGPHGLAFYMDNFEPIGVFKDQVLLGSQDIKGSTDLVLDWLHRLPSVDLMNTRVRAFQVLYGLGKVYPIVSWVADTLMFRPSVIKADRHKLFDYVTMWPVMKSILATVEEPEEKPRRPRVKKLKKDLDIPPDVYRQCMFVTESSLNPSASIYQLLVPLYFDRLQFKTAFGRVHAKDYNENTGPPRRERFRQRLSQFYKPQKGDKK